MSSPYTLPLLNFKCECLLQYDIMDHRNTLHEKTCISPLNAGSCPTLRHSCDMQVLSSNKMSPKPDTESHVNRIVDPWRQELLFQFCPNTFFPECDLTMFPRVRSCFLNCYCFGRLPVQEKRQEANKEHDLKTQRCKMHFSKKKIAAESDFLLLDFLAFIQLCLFLEVWYFPFTSTLKVTLLWNRFFSQPLNL